MNFLQIWLVLAALKFFVFVFILYLSFENYESVTLILPLYTNPPYIIHEICTIIYKILKT